MSKYKVLTIAIAVKNNRIARFGETVDDSELTVNASELIKAGSLELIKEKKLKEVAAVTEEKVIKKAESAAEKAAKK